MNPIKSHLLNRLRPKVDLMTETEYLPLALRTWTAPLRGTEEGRQYLMYGLLSEFGEVADVLKKQIRNGTVPDDVRRRLVDEIGDVLWYATVITYEAREKTTVTVPEWVRMMLSDESGHDFARWVRSVGISFDECRAANIAKLTSRAERGVIQGSGGDR